MQTLKNSQTKNFYKDCGFDILSENEDSVSYRITLNENTKNMIDYINIITHYVFYP